MTVGFNFISNSNNSDKAGTTASGKPKRRCRKSRDGGITVGFNFVQQETTAIPTTTEEPGGIGGNFGGGWDSGSDEDESSGEKSSNTTTTKVFCSGRILLRLLKGLKSELKPRLKISSPKIGLVLFEFLKFFEFLLKNLKFFGKYP